ncbi:amidase signature domain-containing protein [Plectosphaerella plurivora]|uniref:amidase n=1 Tax=Plectosphaerella plurivora TaxID=936078 RepID=A0A9P8VA94_9PEZI|nr:amidase signature domain-containing protein [Plectosphaerella plurivora]
MRTTSRWAKTLGARQILQDSLNPDWLLPLDKLPPKSQKNVSNFIETSGALTARELEITAKSAVALVTDMAAGSLTAVETVTAFLKRAHVAHQLTNFATEFMCKDALDAAKDLDAHFAATGKLAGPLHGLPISTKEHIGFKGQILHSGYVAWVDNVADEDALIVTMAKKAGAVFHVRTNVPQVVMHLDCSNPIYGTTVNPHNRDLTPGGSSGGEGVSLGMRCAALGLGTDVGGSVRVPAAFCGSVGLKTTSLRNPYGGICLPGIGHESVRCVVSPLANSIGDIALFEDAILGMAPWETETSLVPLPWKKVDDPTPQQLTIGVIWDDGVVHPHPPVLRALGTAVEKLKAAGCNVIDWEPYQHAGAADLIKALYFPDGGAAQWDLLIEGGEPVAHLTECAIGTGKGKPLPYSELWSLNNRRDDYRDKYNQLMRERGVDFILSPAYVGAAAVCGQAEYFHYTSIWNILDQPSITFQTGIKVDPAVDVVDSGYQPRSETDAREYKNYDPKTFEGAPIALQLTGKRYGDEEVVAAAEVLSKIIQG